MSETENHEVEMTDDQILEHNQKIRMRLVKDLTKDGMPTDKDDKYILLGSLKDMDKQVIDKKRVAIEDKNANIANTVAAAVTKIADLVDGGDPFRRKNAGVIPETEKDKLPDYTPLPGETEVGITNENYESFMLVNGKNANQSVGIE